MELLDEYHKEQKMAAAAAGHAYIRINHQHFFFLFCYFLHFILFMAVLLKRFAPKKTIRNII